MNNEQTKVQIENQAYRLAEMADAMQISIENAEKVATEQEALVEVLEKSESAEKFKELIEKCKEQVINIRQQIKVLVLRKSLLEQVVAACNEDNDIERIISMLLDGLAVFNKHTKESDDIEKAN